MWCLHRADPTQCEEDLISNHNDFCWSGDEDGFPSRHWGATVGSFLSRRPPPWAVICFRLSGRSNRLPVKHGVSAKPKHNGQISTSSWEKDAILVVIHIHNVSPLLQWWVAQHMWICIGCMFLSSGYNMLFIFRSFIHFNIKASQLYFNHKDCTADLERGNEWRKNDNMYLSFVLKFLWKWFIFDCSNLHFIYNTLMIFLFMETLSRTYAYLDHGRGHALVGLVFAFVYPSF